MAKVAMRMYLEADYLLVSPLNPDDEAALKSSLEAKDSDLIIPFWGEGIREALDEFDVPVSRRRSLRDGAEFHKGLEVETLRRWVVAQKEAREHREEVISAVDKTQLELSRLFTREKRVECAEHERVASAILPYMDGSTVLWLSVILSAKKDFLRLHEDPRRIPEWEELHTNSPAGISEDAWVYITARDFIFRDDYYIDLDDPISKKLGQAVTLDDLLSWLVETCKSHAVDSSFVNPSIEHFRAQVARATGDPKLITKYCTNPESEEPEL